MLFFEMLAGIMFLYRNLNNNNDVTNLISINLLVLIKTDVIQVILYR